MDILWELYEALLQLGPGSEAETKRALSLVPNVNSNMKILDIGCGTGRQTLTLAKLTHAQITAIDIHDPFLDKLNKNAQIEGLSEYIETKNVSMDNINFKDKKFDIIWSEGAIYIIGIEKGLTEWKKFLSDFGYLVISDVAYLRDDIPSDLKKFWDLEYPAIKTIEQSKEIMNKCGYDVLDSFVLNKSSWKEKYYEPMDKVLVELSQKYKGNKKVEDLIKIQRDEIELYNKYHDYYGYVFYIMKKN